MAINNLVQLLIFAIVVIVALDLVSSGAEGAIQNPSILGAAFALVILFVGLSLLSNVAEAAT